MRRRGAIGGGARALAALLALALGAPGIASAADAEPRLGISVNRVFNDNWFDEPFVDKHLAAAQASGIRLAREDAFWMAVESNPPEDGKHTYDWAFTDFTARKLTEYGFGWLPILDYSALWAGSAGEHSPPKDMDDYAAYARAFAERYGREGEFWDLHPELPSSPVTVYEIWNEPNGAWFWHPSPDPRAYADMYTRARAAIRSVDPDAIVMIGGLMHDNDYVGTLFDALARSGTEVDAIGFHPYAPTPAEVYEYVRSFRATLDSLGEEALPIYITELGWPTSGGYTHVRPESERAAYLPEVADTLLRSDCGIRQVIPYTWTTPEADPGNSEDWFGIHHWKGGDTLTSTAYSRLVQAYEDGTASTEVVHLCHDPPPSERPAEDGAPAATAGASAAGLGAGHAAGAATAGTTAGPVVAPPADVAAPELRVSLSRHRRRTLLRRGLRARVWCSEACSVAARVTLSARGGSARTGGPAVGRIRRSVGFTSVSVGANRTLPVTIRLTRSGRSLLRIARKPRLRLTLTAADAAGNRARAVRTLAPRG